MVWLLVQPMIINSIVSGLIPASAIPEGSSPALLSEVARMSQGMCAVGEEPVNLSELSATTESFEQVRDQLALSGVAVATLSINFEAAIRHAELSLSGAWMRNVAVIAVVVLGLWPVLAGSRRRSGPEMPLSRRTFGC